MNRPLPFARVVRCDSCARHETVTMHERHDALMRGSCPNCGRRDQVSRSVDMDARMLTRTAMRADA